MIEYMINQGKNKGVHYIFESTTEAISYLTRELSKLNVNNQNISNPLNAFSPWYTARRGDWVKSDDGLIIQCLNQWDFYPRTNKGEKRYYVSRTPVCTYTFRFCFGVFYKYNKKDGSLSSSKCAVREALQTYNCRQGRMSKEYHPLGKYRTKKKKLFAYYVAQTGDPVGALLKTYEEFRIHARTKKEMIISPIKVAVDLMTDKYVIQEIQKHVTDMESFKDILKKSLEDNGATVDQSIKAIAEVLLLSKPGMAKLEAAKISLNLHRYAMDDTGKIEIDGSVTKPQIPQNTAPAKFEDLPDLPDDNLKKKEVSTFAQKVNQVAIESNPRLITVDDLLPPEIT